MELKTTEFFRNIKTLPPAGSKEFNDLIKWEEEKILGGVNVNGVHIPGWLYWHTNHWWIRIDDVDEHGNDVRVECNPELRDNEWIRAEALEQCKRQRSGYLEVGARQGGKDLLNSSLLYTETKEITIGACNIGDRIYGEDGELTTITGKYPQGIKPVYKITLLDGRELFCGLEHNWFVKNKFTRKNKTEIKTTSDLLKDFKRYRESWKDRKNSYEFKYAIPTNEAVNYPNKNLEIDPYILGLWLGDGSNTYTKITTIDSEIVDSLYKFAKSLGLQITLDGEITYMITSGKKGGDKKLNKIKNVFHTFLQENSLYNNKYIPEKYLYSSKEQRMELLRGLMDSDGSCDKTGSIEFSSSIPKLAKDFYKLCRSLGIVLTNKVKPTHYKKDGVKIQCKDTNRFTLFTDLPVFKLTRKINNIKCKSKYKDWVSIVDIRYVEDNETTCITVDNKSHLFLTDNYTVTHNSEMEASYFAMNAVMFKNTQNVIVCGNDNDLSLLKDKVDFGLRKLWNGISIPRLDKTWRSNQVRLGYKTPNGDDEIWSYIVIRNAKDGHNTEVAAGTTAKSFIMDEVGKYPFASAFKAAEPAFKGKNGWRAVPILVGCLTAGNKVFTKQGNLVNIEDLQQEDGIIGFDKVKQTCSLENILHINPPQEKECYKITTNKGTELECSYDHPILVKHRDVLETFSKNKRRRKLEFIETKNLSIGDSICFPDIVPLTGNKKMKDPYFIGAIIGDGNYSSDRGIRFYNEDDEIWDYFDSIGKQYKVSKTYTTKKGRTYKEVRFYGGMAYLKPLGIYGQSKDKKDLPKDIHLYNEHDVCELIAGLYDTDGCVIVSDKNNYISITSISKKMIMSLKLLLIRLGIHSNLSAKKSDNRERHIQSKNETYVLDVSDKESILIFSKKINLKMTRKKDKLKQLNLKFLKRNSKTDRNYKGLRIEKIIEILPTGNKPVYNLTTSYTHTYLANGVITHNTGGSFDNGKDAENFFYNPEANNFLPFDAPDNKKTGLFLSGLYRQDCKIKTTLADYLINVKGMSLPNISELSKIEMWVSDQDKAEKVIKKEREAAKQNPDRTIYLKQIMYFPLTADECFLSSGENIFDVEAAKRQKSRLLYQERTGTPVILFDDGDGVKHQITDKLPITNFPLKTGDDKDAPVVIYEFPMSNPPYGLYVAGVDPYRQGKSAYSSSLGSVYIYKRMHDITSDKFQDMFVASYTARPDKKEVWEEQARMLIKYYNARALVENDEISFIDYMIAKGDAHYLERQPAWLQEIVPNTTVRRDYGIHRSAEKIRNFLHGCLKKYTEESIHEEKDEEGNITSRVLGMSKIFDPVLLEEIIQYNDDGNYDRIIAAELAIGMAMKMDPVFGKIKEGGDKRISSLYSSKKKKNKMFNSSKSVFARQSNKLFK